MFFVLKIKQKIVLFLYTIFLFFALNYNLKAIPLPFTLMMKPYIGTTIKPLVWSTGSEISNSTSFFNSFYKLENIQIDAGLRVHRNFGFEFFFSRLNYTINKFSLKGDFNAITLGSDFKIFLQLPFLDFLEFIGTNIELYGGVGFAYLSTNLNMAGESLKVNTVVPKYSGGIQIRIMGSLSIRTGFEIYHMSVSSKNIGIGTVILYTVGIHYYFF